MKAMWLPFSGAAVGALAAVPAMVHPGTASAQEAPGRVLYEKHCKMCHGPVGGAPAAALQKQMGVPSLFEPGFLEARSDDSLLAVRERGAGKFMRPMAGTLEKEEMRVIAKFLRASAEAAAPKKPKL